MTPNRKSTNEFLFFALRNWKVLVGALIILIFLLLAIFGPGLTENQPLAFVYPMGASEPSSDFWLGTTMFGQDVFSHLPMACGPHFMWGCLGVGLGPLSGF